jgi:(p)ppGpp synthase/HD superfamily hydrolase
MNKPILFATEAKKTFGQSPLLAHDLPLTLKMIDFAEWKHESQVRRGSGQPYFVHPFRTGEEVALRKKDSIRLDILGAAGIGHDLLEDTDCTPIQLAEEFGYAVTSIILELTNDPKLVAKYGKEAYIDHKLAHLSSYALTLKLCDMLDNIRDQPRCKTLARICHHVDFLKKRVKLTPTQTALVHDISEVLDTYTTIHNNH